MLCGSNFQGFFFFLSHKKVSIVHSRENSYDPFTETVQSRGGAKFKQGYRLLLLETEGRNQSSICSHDIGSQSSGFILLSQLWEPTFSVIDG